MVYRYVRKELLQRQPSPPAIGNGGGWQLQALAEFLRAGHVVEKAPLAVRGPAARPATEGLPLCSDACSGHVHM